MGKTYDLLLVGDYCLDLVFAGLPKFPELGLEVVAENFAMVPGGSYNTAIALHRLGVQVGWAGDFGNDPYSQLVLKCARDEGIDTSLFVHHQKSMRRITVSASYPNDRAFIAYYDPEPAIPSAMKALATSSAKVLHIAGLYHGTALDAGLLMLHAKRMKLVMDGNCEDGTSLSDTSVKKAISATDLFLPNSGEVHRLTGEADLQRGIQVLTKLCPLVVVKDGPGGAYACTPTQTLHAPAIEVDPVDTTGAGDCFNAGFISAWMNGLPLMECLQWGNIAGGLSTLSLGGTGRVVRKQDITDWMKKYSR